MTDSTQETADSPELAEVPEVPEDARIGRFSVYNRTLGQYVGGTHEKAPTKSEASKMVPRGHVAVVVPV